MKQIEKTCDICARKFTTSYSKAKYCSNFCSRKRQKQQTKQGSIIVKGSISSSSVGAIAELAVSAELMLKGYAVFRALSPASYCDTIAVRDGVVFHVEIRTGYRREDGRISFPNGSKGLTNLFGVWERNKKTVHFFNLHNEEITLD